MNLGIVQFLKKVEKSEGEEKFLSLKLAANSDNGVPAMDNSFKQSPT